MRWDLTPDEYRRIIVGQDEGILRLAARVAGLAGRIAELEMRLAANPAQNSHTPPSAQGALLTHRVRIVPRLRRFPGRCRRRVGGTSIRCSTCPPNWSRPGRGHRAPPLRCGTTTAGTAPHRSVKGPKVCTVGIYLTPASSFPGNGSPRTC
jgi:hypothetical protein